MTGPDGGAGSGPRPPWRWDVALSFAGAQRSYVEQVAVALQARGVRCFYDADEEIGLWGKSLAEILPVIYGEQAATVVLFASAEYAARDWTRLERRAALARAVRERREYVLPARFDDTQLPGLLPDVSYIDLRSKTPQQFAATIAAKLAALGVAPPTPAADDPDLAWHAGSLRPVARRIWGNVPARNPGFTGRRKLLATVRRRLVAENRAVVQALHGMGGVGKTQLAVEYAHRFVSSYDVVWWITAEQTGLIGEQFAALAEAMGCAQPDAGLEVVRREVLAKLQEQDRWLLVFDNAESPEDVAGWLPGGSGHVLITSRTRRWTEIAVPVEVDVLARTESVKILRDRVRGLSTADADRLAEALGDLPLGVSQAAAYMAETGIDAGEYTALLVTRAGEVLDKGRPPSYPQSLAAAIRLTLVRLRGDDPGAADLAGICAFLAPEPIPADWFIRSVAELPAPLDERATDPVAWRQVLAGIGRSALARVDGDALQMHRLTQAVLRSQMSAELAAATRHLAGSILAANNPGDPYMPHSWPGWAQLLPHLLALEPAATSITGLHDVASSAAWYLVRRGDARAGHDLAQRLYRQWRDQLGPDDSDTLQMANALAYALREMGRSREARDLDEDTLTRRRRVLGDDHPDTLVSASNLAVDLRELGEPRAARELDEDTLTRRRRVLGDDHPDTLASASNLAVSLRALREPRAARELDEDTLTGNRRLLGDDHPSTLASANGLAMDLRALGEPQAAWELDKDTLARKRRVLGDDHPSTLNSANNLAEDLRALGEPRAAREVDEDTLTRRRRVLGDDHPSTLISASNLAEDLRALGEPQAAWELDKDTLARKRRVLGDNHPSTLISANNLAEDLRALGEIQ